VCVCVCVCVCVRERESERERDLATDFCLVNSVQLLKKQCATSYI